MNTYNIKAFLCLFSLYLANVIVLLLFQGPQSVAYTDTFYLTAPVVAIIAGVLAFRSLGWSGKRMQVIKLVMGGLVSWLLGELIWYYYARTSEVPSVSIADVLFIVGYALFCTAVVYESKLFGLRWREINSRIRAVLITTFVLSAGVVTYIGVTGFDPDADVIASFVAMSQVAGDLAMMGLSLLLLALVWKYQQGTIRWAWLWFMMAGFVNFIADIIYYLSPEEISSGSWMTTFLNITWATTYFLVAGYLLEIRSEIIRLRSTAGIVSDKA